MFCCAEPANFGAAGSVAPLNISAAAVAGGFMLSHGVPALVVSKILGHSRPSITLGICAHATLDMQDQAASVMDEIVSPVAVVIPQLQPSATNCNPAGATAD